jgi:molybdate transport system substrate-binding protein
MRPSERKLRRLSVLTVSVLGVLFSLCTAHAEDALVAVAANFLDPLRTLVTAFEAETGQTIAITAGSTGQLYAQIVSGAPFDLLLAADQERPRLLLEAGYAGDDRAITYAIGRLALWSSDRGRVGSNLLSSLGAADFRWLAIANPETAPYGAAARQTLEALDVWESLQPRLVRGQSVAQAFAMVQSGNAELGLIALSQALAHDGHGSYAIVPHALHAPIRQDAVLLRRGRDNRVARDFLRFLTSASAADIIVNSGYDAPLLAETRPNVNAP